MKQLRPNDWYMLIQDSVDDWYLIPTWLKKEFEEWAYEKNPNRKYHEFESHRLGMAPTNYVFSDWKERP